MLQWTSLKSGTVIKVLTSFKQKNSFGVLHVSPSTTADIKSLLINKDGWKAK